MEAHKKTSVNLHWRDETPFLGYKRRTLGMGDMPISGCIPTDVLFASIIPVSGWKSPSLSSSIASPPTASANSLALA